MDAPLNFSSSYLSTSTPLATCSATDVNQPDLTDLDRRAIAYVLGILNNKMQLSLLTSKLTHTAGWKDTIVSLIDIENIEKRSLSENGIVEIVKLLVTLKPAAIINNIEYSEIKDQEGLLEIAKISTKAVPSIFLDSIEYFGIQNQPKLVDLIIACVKDHATLVMAKLPYLKIGEGKELLRVLCAVSDFRPDLVLNALNYFRVNLHKEIDQLILKCLNQVPYVAQISKQIKIWVENHHEVLLASTSPAHKQIAVAVSISPTDEMQKVFEIFEKFAKEPQNELVCRKLWYDYYDNKKNKFNNYDVIYELNNKNEKNKTAILARCGMTTDALMSAIFGVRGFHTSIKYWRQGKLNIKKLNRIWKVIKDNEDSFIKIEPSHFFAYSISSEKIDHSFVVIQHRNKNEEIKYRLLQSWVNKHDLEDYMNNRNIDISSLQFDEFKATLSDILLNDNISYQKEIFYEQYFMTEFKNITYKRNHHFRFEWGQSCLKSIYYHQAQFETFKANHTT